MAARWKCVWLSMNEGRTVRPRPGQAPGSKGGRPSLIAAQPTSRPRGSSRLIGNPDRVASQGQACLGMDPPAVQDRVEGISGRDDRWATA